MSYQVRAAELKDSQSILRLFSRTPQPGRITLNFERSPCYFQGAHVSCETPAVFVAEETHNGRIVGVGNIGSRSLYVNGEPQSIRYAHDLRVEPTYRGGPVLFDLYNMIRTVTQPTDWLQAVILADNAPYINAVKRAKKGWPQFYPYGVIETSMIFGKRGARAPKTSLEIRPATEPDLTAMQAFLDQQGPRKQFFPAYRFDQMAAGAAFYQNLRVSDYWLAYRGSELVGMIGVWDQKTFKQTRVVQYSSSLKVLRHLYNVHSLVRGGPHLPAAGGQLSYLTLHTVLVKDNDTDLFKVMLDTLHARLGQRYDAIVCGFFEQDPLASVMPFYRRETLRSQHFMIAYEGDPRETINTSLIPYVDIARL